MRGLIDLTNEEMNDIYKNFFSDDKNAMIKAMEETNALEDIQEFH